MPSWIKGCASSAVGWISGGGVSYRRLGFGQLDLPFTLPSDLHAFNTGGDAVDLRLHGGWWSEGVGGV